MGAEEWDRYVAEIKETLRKWRITVGSDTLQAYIFSLRGRDRQRFWRQALYTEAERSVKVAFLWRDPYRLGARLPIQLTAKSRQTPWENAEMLAKALEAIRLAEGRGSTRAMVQLYRQMFPVEQQRQTPPREEPRRASTPEWARTLHISPDAPLEVAEAAYRALSKRAHPDYGGSHDTMKALNRAIEQARLELARAS
jgi:hypothetical protein